MMQTVYVWNWCDPTWEGWLVGVMHDVGCVGWIDVERVHSHAWGDRDGDGPIGVEEKLCGICDAEGGRVLQQRDSRGVGSVIPGGTAGDARRAGAEEEADPDAVPEAFSHLEGRPKSSFHFQWDGAGCKLVIPLSHGEAKTKFKGQIAKPVQTKLTPVVSKESHSLSGNLELSFPETCPSDFSGLIALMQQGRFSADSDDVGVVHPTIKTKAMIEGVEVLDIVLSDLKVHFETSMPLQLFKGQFGVAFKIKMVEGSMVAKNSTFKYSASLKGMSTNGASSGEIKPEEGDVILSVPSLSYTFDTAQVLGSAAPVRLLLTFISNITAEFVTVMGPRPAPVGGVLGQPGQEPPIGLAIYPVPGARNSQSSIPFGPPGEASTNIQGGRRSSLPSRAPTSSSNRQRQQGGLVGVAGPVNSQRGAGTIPSTQSAPQQQGSLPSIGPSTLQPNQINGTSGESNASSPTSSKQVLPSSLDKKDTGLPGRRNGSETWNSSRLLFTVIILGSPVLLSFFLSIGMGINAVIYLWEENSLKSSTMDCTDTISSIPDDSSESEIELGGAGGNIMWSTGDLSTIRGTQLGNDFGDTEFSMATVSLHRTEEKDFPTKTTKGKYDNFALNGTPTLKNFLCTDSNKGLTFEDLFCAVPEKSAFQQRFKQRRPALEWKLLEKYSTLQMNKQGYKIILHHCTGSAQFGELTGVIGPEGSGKSTLLKLISGRIKDLPRAAVVSGAVHAEKFPGQKATEFSLACLSEDSLLPNILTVEEILINSAVLSNAAGNARTMAVVRKHVGDIVEMLDLNSILQNSARTRGSRISPLQKKKILVAKELATMPDALILDSPDSGLDSRDTLEIMSSYRKIAKSGLLVLVATRQLPSEAFHMLDRIFLLSRGRPVYHGLAKEMSTFFSSVGCPCPLETPVSQHALRTVSKPTSLVQILTSPHNPLRIENSEELSDFFSRKRLSRVRRHETIELGILDQTSAEPSDSPVAAHCLLETSRECLAEPNDAVHLTDEQCAIENGFQTGVQSDPIGVAQPIPSGKLHSRNSLSRSPQTPGRIALETAILEDAVGQVSIPASARARGSARKWRNSISGADLNGMHLNSDAGLEVLNTAGSEFGDSVLEFDILSNPPTWRSGASTFRNSHTAMEPASAPHCDVEESEDGLTARSALLYQRNMNPFDSGSDFGENVNATSANMNSAGPSNAVGGMDFSIGGTHELYGLAPTAATESRLRVKGGSGKGLHYDNGREFQMSDREKELMACASPAPSSPLSLSPTASMTLSPYDDDDDDDLYLPGSETPRLLDNKWPMAVIQGPQNSKAESAGDSSCGSLAFDTRRPMRITVVESKIPRQTDHPNDRPVIVQPGVSKIAKLQSGIQHGCGDDGLLCSDRQMMQRPAPTVPILNLSRVPSLNLDALIQHAVPQGGKNSRCLGPSQGIPLEEGDTPPRTGRSSTSGIIQPVPRGDVSNRSIPSHRDQPFRIQPGTGVVSSGSSFEMFAMDWQGRSTSRSRSGSVTGGHGQGSMSLQDIHSEETPKKIGNLDTSRSMAAYAEEVAAYAHEDIARRETEMSMMALAPQPPERKQGYFNSIRGLGHAPFRLELASVFIMAIREIVRKKTLLPLHLLVAAVLGLIMGVLFYRRDNNTKGLSQRVMIIYSLLCLLTAATLALFQRAKIETIAVRADTRLLRYRPGSVVLVKACVENTCLRIAPVVVFAMIFLPLSGIQSGTLRFLLFVSGLSMFWFSITAALYVILAVLPFAVGRYFMTLQLTFHGPLICGFLIPRFRLWFLMKIMAMFSAFCNVFEILALSELIWKTGEIVGFEESSEEGSYKHAFPSKMGLEEDRMVQDAAISVGVYISILALFWLALTVRARWGCQAQLQ